MTMLQKIKKIVALSLAMTLGLLTLCYCTPSIPSTPSEEPGTETDDLPTILPTIAACGKYLVPFFRDRKNETLQSIMETRTGKSPA